jgi:hypothetical protein
MVNPGAIRVAIFLAELSEVCSCSRMLRCAEQRGDFFLRNALSRDIRAARQQPRIIEPPQRAVRPVVG